MSALMPSTLGCQYVSDSGRGPVTVFYHSLFVDQSSWRLVIDALGSARRMIVVDAPNHGQSEPVEHDFTIHDCARAVCELLDAMNVTEPVDWVGNALGGHVGIALAATRPERVRSLVTVGTPVEPFRAVEKWTQIVPLVQLYRAFGPKVVDPILTKALLGSDAIAARPDQVRMTMDAFRNANRPAMLRAMRCLMLRRPSFRKEISQIACPTLFLVAEDGQEGWTPGDSLKAAQTMTNAISETLPGAGNVAPLILAPELLAARLQEFWVE